MNQTTNYNLNQWEAADRVKRADFNADNAKIDAALKAVADAASGGATTLLKTYTLAADATGGVLDFDVSDVDFGAWDEIYIDTHLSGSGGLYLRPNGRSDSVGGYNGTLGSLMVELPYRLTLFPLRTASAYLHCTDSMTGTYAINMNVTYGALTRLQFNLQSGTSISAGGTITLRGLR